MVVREMPYTNLHDLNIDWILKIVKEFKEKYENLDETFQSMLSEIEAKGQQAITAINEGKESALSDISAFKDACVSALNELLNSHLSAINTAGNAQIELIERTGTETAQLMVDRINTQGNVWYETLQSIVDNIPATYEDAVDQLSIINSILNMNYTYPSLIQGYYKLDDDNETISLQSGVSMVSTVLTSGCAGRTLDIDITNGTAIIQYIRYFTGWDDDKTQTTVQLSTSGDEKTHVTYTFPNNVSYATILFTYDIDGSQPLTPSDFVVDLQWKTPLTDMIYELNTALNDSITAVPNNNLYPGNSTLEQDIILNANGAEVQNSNYATTDYIDVSGIGTVGIYFQNPSTGNIGVDTNARHVCFYDENKNYVQNSHDDGKSGTYTVPQNAKYIRFSKTKANWNAYPEMVSNIDNGTPAAYIPYGVTRTLNNSPYLVMEDLDDLPFMTGTALTQNTDLNSLTDGVYYANGSSLVASLTNRPSEVSTGAVKIVTITIAGTNTIQYLWHSAGALYYRAKTSTYDTWHKASDSLSLLTLNSERKIASYDNGISPELYTYTGSGATYADGKWTIQPEGSISCSLSLTTGVSYRITIDMNTVDSQSQKGELARHFYATIGEETISLYAAGDYHPDIVFTATETGTATFTISTDNVVSIAINAVRVVPIASLPTYPIMMNSLKGFGYGQSICFGNGQSALLYGTVDAENDLNEIDAECGKRNTGFGNGAQNELNTGCWNTGIGYNSQTKLTNGKGNTAVGAWTQSQMKSGLYNNAFGESAQGRITDGNWNDAHGIEAQGFLTTGCNNVAMGRRSQHKITTGSRNVAIGAWSGFMANDMAPEGAWATTEDNNQVLVGASATKFSGANADDLVAVGYRARGAKDSVAVGSNAKANGEGSIAIGKGASTTNDNEMVLGGLNINSVIIAGKKITFNQDGTVTWEALT